MLPLISFFAACLLGWSGQSEDILKRAIENLELFYCNCANELRRPELRPVLLMTLAGFTAEELASDEAFMLLSKRFRALRTKFSNRALPSKLKCGLTGFGSCS